MKWLALVWATVLLFALLVGLNERAHAADYPPDATPVIAYPEPTWAAESASGVQIQRAVLTEIAGVREVLSASATAAAVPTATAVPSPTPTVSSTPNPTVVALAGTATAVSEARVLMAERGQLAESRIEMGILLVLVLSGIVTLGLKGAQWLR